MYPYNTEMPIKKAGNENLFAQNSNNDEKLAELMIMAIEEEANDEQKYKALAAAAVKEEDVEILRSIFLDESRHKKLLGEIYEELYGVVPQVKAKEYNFEGADLAAKYNKNIISEVQAARFYRDLANMFTDQEIINTIMSILNDEQNHSVLNVYLFHNNH